MMCFQGQKQAVNKTGIQPILILNDIFSINFKYNEDLSFQYISDFEFDPTGRYNKIQSKYKIQQGLELVLAAEFFNGKSDSYYGRWERNDRLITALKYSF